MKVLTGKVISTKMAKTATVAVERTLVHKLYRKRFKRTKKYHVHDEFGAKVGEMVNFVDSKPFSKLKKWKVIKVLSESENNEAKDKEKRKITKPTEKVMKVQKGRY